jgi:MFS family permease
MTSTQSRRTSGEAAPTTTSLAGPGRKVGRTGAAHSGQRQSPWLVLRQRQFRHYFIGSFVSNLGTWLQNVGQIVFAYQITHSVFAVGLIVSAQFAAIPLVSPWGGVLANLFGARRMLVVTQATAALIAAAMASRAAMGMFGEHTLIVGALGLGLVYSLALPVQVSLVPALVDPADAEAAMQMNSVSYNAGRAVAPALSVFLLVVAGPVLIFSLNALSFFVFALVLVFLPRGMVGRQSGLAGGTTDKSRRRAQVTDGFRIALHYRRILLLMALVASVTFADDPITVLSPALTNTVLHVSSEWTGYFIAALGCGAVAASFRPKRRADLSAHPAARNASRRAAWRLLVLAGSVVLFAAGLCAAASAFFAFVAGAAALSAGAAAQTPIIVKDKRSAASVAALWAIAWAGTKPLASLVDGWLASQVGIFDTALLIVAPAVILAACELGIPEEEKKRIKKWAGSVWIVRKFSLDPAGA